MEWYQNHGLKTQNLAHSIHIVKKVFDLGLEAPHVQCVPEYIRTYANWLVSALPISEIPMLAAVCLAASQLHYQSFACDDMSLVASVMLCATVSCQVGSVCRHRRRR